MNKLFNRAILTTPYSSIADVKVVVQEVQFCCAPPAITLLRHNVIITVIVNLTATETNNWNNRLQAKFRKEQKQHYNNKSQNYIDMLSIFTGRSLQTLAFSALRIADKCNLSSPDFHLPKSCSVLFTSNHSYLPINVVNRCAPTAYTTPISISIKPICTPFCHRTYHHTKISETSFSYDSRSTCWKVKGFVINVWYSRQIS